MQIDLAECRDRDVLRAGVGSARVFDPGMQQRQEPGGQYRAMLEPAYQLRER
jgi:hypothetical protein